MTALGATVNLKKIFFFRNEYYVSLIYTISYLFKGSSVTKQIAKNGGSCQLNHNKWSWIYGWVTKKKSLSFLEII